MVESIRFGWIGPGRNVVDGLLREDPALQEFMYVDALSQLDLLFLLTCPDAPEMWFAGGVSEDQGLTGVGCSKTDALVRLIGELAELRGLAAAADAAKRCDPDPIHGIQDRLGLTAQTLMKPGTRNIPAGLLTGAGPARSEGCAAAQDAETAWLGGLLELIERDAVSLWWSAGHPASHLRTLPVSASGRERHILDLTTDLGVPVVAALSFDSTGREFACGHAAALNQADAEVRATRELIQMETGLHLISHKLNRLGDANLTPSDKKARDRADAIESGTLLQAIRDGERGQPTRPEPPDDAEGLIRTLDRAGIEVYRLDLPAQFGLCVTKLISPHLQPSSPEFPTDRLRTARAEGGDRLPFSQDWALL